MRFDARPRLLSQRLAGRLATQKWSLPVKVGSDHFRYFAGCIRAQEGTLAELDDNTVAYLPLSHPDHPKRAA